MEIDWSGNRCSQSPMRPLGAVDVGAGQREQVALGDRLRRVIGDDIGHPHPRLAFEQLLQLLVRASDLLLGEGLVPGHARMMDHGRAGRARPRVAGARRRGLPRRGPRHHDVPDGLRDRPGDPRQGGRGPGLRLAVVPRALAHPDLADLAVSRRRRPAPDVRAHLRPVRRPHGRGGRDDDAEGRHRHLPGDPARHHPHRQGGREPRPALRRPVPVRRRCGVEPRGDGRSRHEPEDPHAAAGRADQGHEGAVDPGRGRVPRRLRGLRSDVGVAQAGDRSRTRRC